MPDITGPLVNFATDQVGSYGLLAVFLLMILESALHPGAQRGDHALRRLPGQPRRREPVP